MSGSTTRSIADSLETDEHLLPCLPYLVQDLWVLGSSVEHILGAMDSIRLPSGSRVLDLGCGKGAVSVRAAERFGCSVLGVDAMVPFLEDARKKAAGHGVSHLCEFVERDIFDFISEQHDFDLVILASLGGIFGSFRETAAWLRTQVRSGGHILIDDGYLKRGTSLQRRGYTHYRDRDATIAELTHFGDRLVGEWGTGAVTRQINEEYLGVIRKRSQELIAAHPELKQAVEAYVRLQAQECEVIDREMEGALWLLRKTVRR